ncbi:Adenosyl-chloride synthase [subsurface metagenome]
MSGGIIALLTDFGNRDGYAGIMKGMLLSCDPELKVVDLTHEIEPFAVISAAYILYSAWAFFPEGTVFCAVVDPGVGSSRGIVLASVKERTVIAPDNGVISLLCRMYPGLEVFSLKSNHPALPGGTSATFHGRDIFAPAAALLASGKGEELKGEAVNPVISESFRIHNDRGRRILHSRIIHIDRFGNSISAIHSGDLKGGHSFVRLKIGSRVVTEMVQTYQGAEAAIPVCLFGSSNFLEIAVRQSSAAQLLGISIGDEISLYYR